MKQTYRVLAVACSTVLPFSLSSCTNEIDALTLPNAYNIQVPDPEPLKGEVLFDGSIETAAMKNMVTTSHTYLIGYQKLDYDELVTWLDSTEDLGLPPELTLRTASTPQQTDVVIEGVRYTTDVAYCFATNRDSNYFATDGVNLTPYRTDDAGDHSVILDVTVMKDSLGCFDGEYYSVVEPGLMQQNRGGGDAETWGDIAGDFIDGAIDGWLNG